MHKDKHTHTHARTHTHRPTYSTTRTQCLYTLLSCSIVFRYGSSTEADSESPLCYCQGASASDAVTVSHSGSAAAVLRAVTQARQPLTSEPSHWQGHTSGRQHCHGNGHAAHTDCGTVTSRRGQSAHRLKVEISAKPLNSEAAEAAEEQ